MSSTMATILRAQSLLMAEHEATSETALGLLVWEADRRGVTVAEVAAGVCASLSTQRRTSADDLLRVPA